MRSDYIADYYDHIGGGYRMSSSRRNRIFALLDATIADFRNKPLSVLDIGVGQAEVARHIRESAVSAPLVISGVDISRKLLSSYAEYYDTTHCCNVEDRSWTHALTRVYDVVVAAELLEHLFRPDFFLERLYTIVRPGGRVILSTPNLLLWTKRIKFLFGIHEYGDSGLFEWGHIHLFSWRNLTRLLEDKGFRIVDTNHVLHPNALNPFHKILPAGMFAFQFILSLQRK